MASDLAVVILNYNTRDDLRHCLDSLRQAQGPLAFEVLVVDDGGGLPLEPVLAPLRDHLALTLLSAPHGGPAAARNVGIAATRGTLLAFTDDDCLPDPGWLSALAVCHARRPDALSGDARSTRCHTMPTPVPVRLSSMQSILASTPIPSRRAFSPATT
mgnify:CR=1 FL=1